MDQDFYFEESNPKKAKLILVGILLLVSIFCIVLIFLRGRYTLNVRKNLVYEAGDKLSTNVADYVSNRVVDDGDYTLLLDGISSDEGILNKVGEYTFKVKYKNITKKGTIKVVDTKAPEVETIDLTIGVDEEIEVDTFVSVCKDYSMPCNVTYEHEKDADNYKKEGEYTFNIIVTDGVGNKVKKSVKLNVKKNYNYKDTIVKDLTIHHVEPELDDWKGDIILKFNKAYDPNEIDETEAYASLMEITAGDLHNYLDPLYMNNEIRETQIIEVFNKSGYIIGYAVRVKLDNGLYFYLKKSST